MKTLVRSLSSLVVLLAPLAAQHDTAPAAQADAPRREAPWDPAVVHAMRTLPVQEGGRIKPFMTFAQYLLLRLNERMTVRIPDEPHFGPLAGAKLNETEWALDVLLHPEQAADYPVIVVTDREALQVIGLSEIARKKRDRYSWNELAPGIARLTPFADEYRRIEEEKRSRLQNQIVNLYEDLHEYAGLQHAFDAARAEFAIGDSATLRSAFGSKPSIRFSEAMTKTSSLIAALQALDQERQADSGAGDRDELERLGRFLEQQYRMAQLSGTLFWLPPVDPKDETWLSYEGAFDQLRGADNASSQAHFEALASLERVVDAAGEPEELGTALGSWVSQVRGMAAERGEGAKIEGEVGYLESDYFYKALVWFLLGFVGCALLWLWPRSKWLGRIAFGLTAVGTGYVSVGLTVRCLLRERPPVTTLYETILFITAVAALVALVIELINRRRIAMSIGAFLGALGMFLAGKFEVADGHDTFHQLQAVLDTNFWLATHVTTVTIGYAAGLLAGTIASVYLLGKLFGLKRGNHAFYRSIGRMVYGALCFGVFFSTVGTILGGVWANYSWGRFWGWDPKENGALLIVLWELMILHGRLGGYWRDWGICMLAVAGNIVVAFSWWGVNLMSVGLHSYGFLGASLKNTVTAYYVSQALILTLGIVAWARERARTRAPSEVRAAAPAIDAEPAEA